MSNYSNSNTPIPLFVAQATLPYPASKSDDTAGYSLDGLASQGGPAKAAVYLEASADCILTDVRVHLFERGEWAAIALQGTGDILFSSLPLKANWPIKFQIGDLAAAKRMTITATISAGTVSSKIQMLEEA